MKLALLGSALALAAGPASAATYDLCAGATTKTLPDGSMVPMWGYATGGATDAGGVLICDNTPSFPAPRLTVPDTDTTLTINLTNTLPEPTSIVIPGQVMPAGGPTWDDGTTGLRDAAADPPQRVRSFGAETAAGTTVVPYTWTGVRPGTFIYHSGTHPQKQVYMGLYGAVTRDAVAATTTTPAQAYPGVEYFNEVVLFYSEIDPDLNAAVAGGTHETSIHYHPQWFLVNGEPYSTACTDVAPADNFDDASGYPCINMDPAATEDITTGSNGSLVANQRTLVRFLSTAGKTHVPTLQGMHMTLHAEDGFQYNWQDGATVMGSAPREQYSVMLPTLKTKDAIVRAPADGRYAVYDGNGYMTNPTSPTDFDHLDPVGGMLRFLAFGAASNEAPVADANGPYSGVTGAPVAFDGTGSTDDGAIVSYDWDFGDGTIVLDAGATPSHTYAFDALATYPVTYDVTLTVTDDSGVPSVQPPLPAATTTATIAANLPPTADPNGPYTGSTGAPVTFDGTDSIDPDGTVVSYAWDFGDGEIGSGPTPSNTYATAGTYTVTLTVTDNAGVTDTATAMADITVANQPPVADAGGPYSASTNASPCGDLDPRCDGDVTFDGSGSTDPDGTIVSYDWDFGDGTVVPDAGATPSHTYTVSSTYIVTLTVTDSGGATATDTAVASIVPNQAPVAEDETVAVPRQGSTPIDVLANDDDSDGTVDPSTIVITSQPSTGTATVVGGQVVYEPPNGNNPIREALFVRYTVADNLGAVSNQATVTINVIR